MKILTNSAVEDMVNEFLDKREDRYAPITWQELTQYQSSDNEAWASVIEDKERLFYAIFSQALYNIQGLEVVPLKELNSNYLNHCVEIYGQAMALSEPEPVLTQARWTCSSCNEVLQNNSRIGDVVKPKCRCSNSKLLLEEDDDYTIYDDRQVIKLQEVVKTAAGHPARISLVAMGSNVWKVRAGQNVRVVGFLRARRSVTRERVSCQKYFEVLYIETQNDKPSCKYTDEDAKRFREDANNKRNYWDYLRNCICPYVAGMNEVKDVMMLLLSSTDTDFPPNALLPGDPSVSKSLLLKYAADVHENGIYLSMASATIASLLAFAQKDEDTGSYIIIPGALPQADGGLLCLDELHTITEDAAKKLNEGLYQKSVSFAKGGQIGSLPARCAVAAACNSVYGRYDEYKSLADNLEFLGRASEPFISRFPFIHITKDIVDELRDAVIIGKVIEQNTSEGIAKYYDDWDKNGYQFYGFKTLRKFFKYILTLPLPDIPQEVTDKISEWYVKKRQEYKNKESNIKPRLGDAALKAIRLRARILHKSVADFEDFEAVVKLLEVTINIDDSTAGHDKQTNGDNNNDHNKKQGENQKNKAEQLLSIFDKAAEVTKEEWIAYLINHGWTRDAAINAIQDMWNKGKVYLPDMIHYQRVD